MFDEFTKGVDDLMVPGVQEALNLHYSQHMDDNDEDYQIRKLTMEIEHDERDMMYSSMELKNVNGPFDDVLTPLVKKSKFLSKSPETIKEKKAFLEELKRKKEEKE